MKKNMKKDDLVSQTQIRELFQYEAACGNLIWKVNCCANKVKGQVAGTITKHGLFSEEMVAEIMQSSDVVTKDLHTYTKE